jgi:DNA mismatch endonuclease (patch repair protein)
MFSAGKLSSNTTSFYRFVWVYYRLKKTFSPFGIQMTDKFSREKRSQIMSKIRSKNTDIEILLMKALEKNCITFEYQPRLFGKPDFLIPPKIIIFCDSSFWHGRNWVELEKTLSKGYWHEHIKRNRERDLQVNQQLAKENYFVLRFWMLK